MDQSRVANFGESLGTAVAVTLAAEHPPAALILRSPFVSMVEIGQIHYPLMPVRWLLRDRDAIIPLEQSRRLFEAAPSRKQFVVIPGADHNDHALLAGAQMVDAIVDVLGPVR